MTIASPSRIDRNARGEIKRVTPLFFINVRDIRPLNLKQIARKEAV